MPVDKDKNKQDVQKEELPVIEELPEEDDPDEELKKKEEFKKQQEAFAAMNGGQNVQNPQNVEEPKKEEKEDLKKDENKPEPEKEVVAPEKPVQAPNEPQNNAPQKSEVKQPEPEPVPEATQVYDKTQAQFEADNKKLTEEEVFKGITSGSFFEENQRRMQEQFSNPDAHEKAVKSGWRKDSLNYTSEELQKEFDKADKAFSGRSIIDSTEEKPIGKRYKDVHQEALEARKAIQELAKKNPEELQTKEVRAQLKNCFAKIALDDIIRRERSIRTSDIVDGKQVPGPVEKTLNQHKNAYADFIKGLETSNTIEERVHEIGRPDAVIKPNKIADFLINKDAQGLSFGLYHESREVTVSNEKVKENILEGLGKDVLYNEKVEENKKGLETKEKVFNDELKFFRDQSDFGMGF